MILPVRVGIASLKPATATGLASIWLIKFPGGKHGFWGLTPHLGELA
jgi:hypothetical protein